SVVNSPPVRPGSTGKSSPASRGTNREDDGSVELRRAEYCLSLPQQRAARPQLAANVAGRRHQRLQVGRAPQGVDAACVAQLEELWRQVARLLAHEGRR